MKLMTSFSGISLFGIWIGQVGKRTNFKRRERDNYETPYEAVVPLLPHLKPNTRFDEPCSGSGQLILHLEKHEHLCEVDSDIISGFDALDLDSCLGDCFITNPPWDWKILNPLITHLSNMAPTWLLLNADLMHNKRMGPHMKHCKKIVSVGRVSWMQNGKNGFENCAWFLFDSAIYVTEFYGREL